MTTYYPINLPPQYYVANPTSYASHVLKCYEEGTSTPLSMATESTGATTVGSIALNASGLPEVSGNVVIPHIDQNYKVALYPSQAAADANSGAVWTVDNIKIGSTANSGVLTDVASASTINLNSTETNYFNITGTTGISTITLSEGAQVWVKFAAALTLTDSVNLVLLGGENITTAAGDIAIFRGEGSSVVRMLAYHRAAGGAVAYASQAEAEAGTATDKIMNPLRTAQAISALVSSTIPNSGYASNQYYHGLGQDPESTATLTVTANRLYAIPFLVGADVTMTRVGFEVTTGAAGAARMGLYTAVNGVPSALITDFGEIADTSSTGEKEITISEALTLGLYFITVVFSGTPLVRRQTNIDPLTRYILGATAGGSANQNSSLYSAHTYGALPSSFGSVNYVNLTDAILLWMRKV